jgi:hypothetical protein
MKIENCRRRAGHCGFWREPEGNENPLQRGAAAAGARQLPQDAHMDHSIWQGLKQMNSVLAKLETLFPEEKTAPKGKQPTRKKPSD